MKRSYKYTKEMLEPIVQTSTCISDVLRNIGLKPVGGNFRHIVTLIRFFDISMAHFLTSSWSKGKTRNTDSRIDALAKKNSLSNEEVFIENSRPINGWKLKKRLINLGWEHKCAECGLTEWRGRHISLHVDHINGNTNDNRLTNLRFLCPNCHQQTETWGKRKH